MVKNVLRLSLVIPVFNEAHHIEGCLKAIQAQSVAPLEVIVVDNNSSDDTVALARQFSFVTVVSQSRQGRGWARSAGFDAAQGEIIGRIDADSRIAPNWVQHVLARFVADDLLSGVTGLANTVLIPRINSIKSTFWSRAYFWFVHATFCTITLWGANMAIRRSDWLMVRDQVCNDDFVVHEDQDISIELGALGLKLEQDNDMKITTGGQTYNYFPKLLHYYHLERNTLQHHRDKGTLKSPKLQKLSFWHVLPGQIYAFVPGIFMGIASLLWWPIDAVMIKLGHEKTWLD